MPIPSRKALHPLLLDPTYWRNRLEELNLGRRSLLVTPRPDLSSSVLEVGEIRMKTHDGIRLWGMMGRLTLGCAEQPARIRFVAADEEVTIDRDAVKEGCVDLVLQEPTGRRLEDRVLDVMRACQTAIDLDGIDPENVTFEFERPEQQPDEVRIASHLLSRSGFDL